MTPFHVSILSRDEVHSLSGAWNSDKLGKVLELADADDIGDVANEDLEEMCVMSLQDVGNQRAGEIVLEAIFGEGMRPGVRQNLVGDLQEDQPWDDFAVVGQQRGIFVAVGLLHKAFPTRYGTPDATRVMLKIEAETDADLAAVDLNMSAWLVRLLACGLEPDSFVHRLYSDELKAGAFTEAAGLIWEAAYLDRSEPDPPSRTIAVTASARFLGSLRAGRQFKAVI